MVAELDYCSKSDMLILWPAGHNWPIRSSVNHNKWKRIRINLLLAQIAPCSEVCVYLYWALQRFALPRQLDVARQRSMLRQVGPVDHPQLHRSRVRLICSRGHDKQKKRYAQSSCFYHSGTRKKAIYKGFKLLLLQFSCKQHQLW